MILLSRKHHDTASAIEILHLTDGVLWHREIDEPAPSPSPSPLYDDEYMRVGEELEEIAIRIQQSTSDGSCANAVSVK